MKQYVKDVTDVSVCTCPCVSDNTAPVKVLQTLFKVSDRYINMLKMSVEEMCGLPLTCLRPLVSDGSPEQPVYTDHSFSHLTRTTGTSTCAKRQFPMRTHSLPHTCPWTCLEDCWSLSNACYVNEIMLRRGYLSLHNCQSILYYYLHLLLGLV